jgi:hypothetical protein
MTQGRVFARLSTSDFKKYLPNIGLANINYSLWQFTIRNMAERMIITAFLGPMLDQTSPLQV